jgi:putative membrane protein (TIGR04086 family)
MREPKKGVGVMATATDKNPEPSVGSGGRIVRAELIGLVAAFVASVLMLVLFSAVMATNQIPGAAITPLSCVSMGVGALFGGFFSGLIVGKKGLIAGAVNGTLLFLIMCLFGLMMKQIDYSSLLPVKAAVCIILAALGGAAGVNLRLGKKKRSA